MGGRIKTKLGVDMRSLVPRLSPGESLGTRLDMCTSA